jgi:hypothetical protein
LQVIFRIWGLSLSLWIIGLSPAPHYALMTSPAEHRFAVRINHAALRKRPILKIHMKIT